LLTVVEDEDVSKMKHLPSEDELIVWKLKRSPKSVQACSQQTRTQSAVGSSDEDSSQDEGTFLSHKNEPVDPRLESRWMKRNQLVAQKKKSVTAAASKAKPKVVGHCKEEECGYRGPSLATMTMILHRCGPRKRTDFERDDSSDELPSASKLDRKLQPRKTKTSSILNVDGF
jgi:hypothetical protein